MENLTFRQSGILSDSRKEFEDLNRLIDIEISTIVNETAKAQLIETKFKTLQAIINLEKQRLNILPKQRV